ncbi:MAG: DUF5103 domain-containing protein [Chitinophagaceae bacterium]
MKRLFFLLTLFLSIAAQAQNENSNIRSIKLHKWGDQTAFPALVLNSNDALELHFDDLDSDIKNYYYSYQLCNADWTPSILTTFDYVKGFQNVRITTYRNSSIATTHYTHYQATIPDRSSAPSRSGNYLLKVFLNGDTTQLAFSRRFVVVDNKAKIGAQVQQPFNAQYFKTHQKLQIGINTEPRLRINGPADLKVVVLQNNNWNTSLYIDRPTIFRGNYFEYNDEAYTAMPAGKEFRWIDLRSLRLMSDRMLSMDEIKDTTHVTVKPDANRSGQTYIYYRDINGSYTQETMESVNPYWQGDYGYVHFSYFPPGNRAIEGNDVYLFGEFTQFGQDTSGRMTFNRERGAYEKTLFLKQGFYNYSYVTLPQKKEGYPDFSATEGNYWGTENSYVVLVYYRAFGARADELIGYTTLSSFFQRQGF